MKQIILVIMGLIFLAGCQLDTETIIQENNYVKESNHSPLYSVNPDELFKEFEDNTFATEEKYLQKYIEINGTVESVWRDFQGYPRLDLNVTLPFRAIACYFDKGEYIDTLKNLSPGDKVTVRGYLTAYKGTHIFIKVESINQ